MAKTLDIEALRKAVADGEIDTVVVAATDMQGRLQGKRLHAPFFLEHVLDDGTEACNYLLTVDVDMNTVQGYEMSSWKRGYGDFSTEPDLATLRRLPWQPGTALVLTDLAWSDGAPVVASPRQILRRQIERLAERGLSAFAGTELEFILYNNTYESAWESGYRAMQPSNQYNVDYSLLGTARVEPLLRRLRNDMYGAGLVPESAKGECNLGQHEVAFRYADALTAADHHVIYKNGAKEIAAQEGMALTFMAKPNANEGNSCHIHLSLRDDSNAPTMATDDGSLSVIGRQAVAGLLATMRDFSLFYAPNINSYKRYQHGSFAPTAIRWGRDNRSCALRLVGRNLSSCRIENRVPGGDVNPYLAISAMIAGVLYGIENELELEDALEGNAYDDETALRVPETLSEAAHLWSASNIVIDAFGSDVAEHYQHYAMTEISAFNAAVTDWELFRGFERL